MNMNITIRLHSTTVVKKYDEQNEKIKQAFINSVLESSILFPSYSIFKMCNAMEVPQCYQLFTCDLTMLPDDNKRLIAW